MPKGNIIFAFPPLAARQPCPVPRPHTLLFPTPQNLLKSRDAAHQHDSPADGPRCSPKSPRSPPTYRLRGASATHRTQCCHACGSPTAEVLVQTLESSRRRRAEPRGTSHRGVHKVVGARPPQAVCRKGWPAQDEGGRAKTRRCELRGDNAVQCPERALNAASQSARFVLDEASCSLDSDLTLD